MKKIMFAVLIVILVILFLGIKAGENDVNYNNVNSYKELITHHYSAKELSDIKDDIANGEHISLFDIVRKKDIECARNTANTRYILLTSENDEKLFIFYDSDSIITDTYYVENNFLKYSDFDDVKENESKRSEVIAIDSRYYVSAFSTIDATIHIVQEGVIVIIYEAVQGTTLLQDPIVDCIRFYDNNELLEMGEKIFL